MSNTVWLDRDTEWGRQQVERFVRSFQPSYRLLAYHAALPSILTPELVNYLRNKFLRQEGVPWIAEVDLLLSDLCQPVGYEQYAMEASVRAYLVENLEQFLGKDRMEEVARLLIGYLNRLARGSSALQRPELKAQQWAAMVYLDDRRGEAVGEIVQAFLDASVSQDTNDLQLANRAEIDRLSRITQELAPQLNNYPNLLEYAQLISQIVADPDRIDRQVLERSFLVTEDVALRVPENLLPEVAGTQTQQMIGFPPLETKTFQGATMAFEEEEENEEKLIEKTISKAMDELLACENLEQFLNKAYRIVKDRLAADRCTLWLVDEERDELWTKIPIAGKLTEIRIPRTGGFAGIVAQYHQPFFIPFDLYDDPRSETSKQTDQKTGYRTCSILCVPVLNEREESVGVIQCINKRRSGNFPPYNRENWPEPPEVWQISFTEEDRDWAIAFAQQLLPLIDSFLAFDFTSGPVTDFHQAWHNQPTSPPATQTLEQHLTNICTQLQHLPLLCIDAEILETETTETAIAQTLCELIYATALPDADYPEVNNAPQLRKHLRPIAQQQGRSRLLILMHNCEPQPEIQQFCRKMANIAHIAWITETPLEPPLRGFAPSQEDLAGAIASWLQELGIDG